MSKRISFKEFIFRLFRFRENVFPNNTSITQIFHDWQSRTKDFTCFSDQDELNRINLEICRRLRNEFISEMQQLNQNQQNQQNQQSQEQDDQNQEQEQNGENGQSQEQEQERDEQEQENQGQSQPQSQSQEQDDQEQPQTQEQEQDDDEDGGEEIEDITELGDTNTPNITKLLKIITDDKKNYDKNLGINKWWASTKIKNNLLKILFKTVGVSGMAQSPIRYGYCGKFSPKKAMVDFKDEGKIFRKNTFEGFTAKTGKKRILNIWLDNSGSFYHYDDPVNEILKALYDCEKQYNDTFEFRLITWGEHFIVKKGSDRISTSDMGDTILTSDLIELYSKFNKTGDEVNIFLTDGAISSSSLWRIEVFNNKKSIIISSKNNQSEIKRYCPNAKKLIFQNSDYDRMLEDNVLLALNLLF
jgi:hypothetical protein